MGREDLRAVDITCRVDAASVRRSEHVHEEDAHGGAGFVCIVWAAVLGHHGRDHDDGDDATNLPIFVRYGKG